MSVKLNSLKCKESRIPIELYHGPMKGNEHAHAAVCTLQNEEASEKKYYEIQKMRNI